MKKYLHLVILALTNLQISGENNFVISEGNGEGKMLSTVNALALRLDYHGR